MICVTRGLRLNTFHKYLLIAVTGVSVVSDSMLIPFYPQFFSSVYQITNPSYVGLYLSVYCLVVMVAFPLWANIAKRYSVLHILLVSQTLAAVMSVACFNAKSVSDFWLFSLCMMLCKASYLLIYPFIMSRESDAEHGGTIGFLGVVVEFGAIFGALSGGVLLQWFNPKNAFLLMAVGDVLQVLVCLYLIYLGVGRVAINSSIAQKELGFQKENTLSNERSISILVKLSFVKLIFFFSAYLTYHFFTTYWSLRSPNSSILFSAVVFAIPAVMALSGLLFNAWRGNEIQTSSLSFSMMLAAIGVLLQTSPALWLVVLGRIVFGWALFQCLVRLDILLFRFSSPDFYAQDYSVVRIAQSIGVLVAVFVAGSIANSVGAEWLFVASGVGISVALFMFTVLFSGGGVFFKSRFKVSGEAQ